MQKNKRSKNSSLEKTVAGGRVSWGRFSCHISYVFHHLQKCGRRNVPM